MAGGRHPAKSKKCRGRFHQNHSESTNMSSLGRENAIHNRITVIYLTKPNKKHCKTHDFNVTLGCKSTWIGGRFSTRRMYDMNRHTQHLPQAKFFEGCMPAASTRLLEVWGRKNSGFASSCNLHPCNFFPNCSHHGVAACPDWRLKRLQISTWVVAIALAKVVVAVVVGGVRVLVVVVVLMFLPSSLPVARG